jgi:hypothetical protein
MVGAERQEGEQSKEEFQVRQPALMRGLLK